MKSYDVQRQTAKFQGFVVGDPPRWIVVARDGSEGLPIPIDGKSYATEEEAWAEATGRNAKAISATRGT